MRNTLVTCGHSLYSVGTHELPPGAHARVVTRKGSFISIDSGRGIHRRRGSECQECSTSLESGRHMAYLSSAQGCRQCQRHPVAK